MISANYTNTLNSYGFDSLIIEATRVSSVIKTCLDHFTVRDIDKANVNILEHQEFSDHDPYSLSFSNKQKLEEGLDN